LPGLPGQVDAGSLAGQADVAEDQVDLLPVERFDRVGEAIERRHHLITGIADRYFIVERRQRLVLDDKDSIDDPLPLPEQHPSPV